MVLTVEPCNPDRYAFASPPAEPRSSQARFGKFAKPTTRWRISNRWPNSGRGARSQSHSRPPPGSATPHRDPSRLTSFGAIVFETFEIRDQTNHARKRRQPVQVVLHQPAGEFLKHAVLQSLHPSGQVGVWSDGELRQEIGRNHEVETFFDEEFGFAFRQSLGPLAAGKRVDVLDNPGHVQLLQTHVRVLARPLPNFAQMEDVRQHDLAESAAQFRERDVEEQAGTDDQGSFLLSAEIRRLHDHRPGALQVGLPSRPAPLPARGHPGQFPHVSHCLQMPRDGRCQILDRIQNQTEFHAPGSS